LKEVKMPIEREYQDHRRKTILKLLTEQPMKRQIEIGRALRKMGFKVTQSTISRDLEAMGVVRRQGVYMPPSPKGDESALGTMEQFIRSVRSAGPYMLIFETSPGMAKAVAVSIKSAAWPEVQGILSEDDTLFVATDNVFDSRLLLQRLKRLVKT
jgi:transcriptional regulator of arginine metabolism